MDRVEVSNYTSEYFENVKCRVSKFNRTTFVWSAQALVKFETGNDITVFTDIRSAHMEMNIKELYLDKLTNLLNF